MCGIIGMAGKEEVALRLLEGLRRLEYRGYDSAGIATITEGRIARCRVEGKIRNLEKQLEITPLAGNTGIGHTRWATHGAPNVTNAHPHATGKTVVVHNGIIENFLTLRAELAKKGHVFQTDTDTEVIPHLITDFLDAGKTPKEAVKAAIARLEGAYALGIAFAGEDNMLVAARHGSPLAIGYGDGEMYLGSDALALVPFTTDIAYLEDGDIAFLTPGGADILDENGRKAVRARVQVAVASASVEKENFRHFMQKEIHEQPRVIGEALRAYYNPVTAEVQLPELKFSFKKCPKLTIIACGTSYYAGMIARYWFERIAKLPVEVEIASEFRYREVVLPAGGAALFISQSGETADTLAAMRYAKKLGQHTLAVVNVPQSTMAREADAALYTYAGPEIGVASTKAFTTQLAALGCLVIGAGQQRGTVPEEEARRRGRLLSEAPAHISEILHHEEEIKRIAEKLAQARDILYIGRGVSYPLAMEGALKLKEISYIHAEAAAAGELKHGPIALVDKNVPVIAIAPSDDLLEKTASNIREVAARGGRIILLSDTRGIAALKDVAEEIIKLPDSTPFISPLLYAVPVQLLAYHTAVFKGTDVDQPRNLAKSVTVE